MKKAPATGSLPPFLRAVDLSSPSRPTRDPAVMSLVPGFPEEAKGRLGTQTGCLCQKEGEVKPEPG